MRAWIAIVLLVFANPAKAEDRIDSDLGYRIMEGAATAEFLWLLGANGVLVRIDRSTGERTILARDGIDLLEDGPRLWALTGQRGQGFQGVIRDLRDEDFSPVTRHVDSGPIALVHGPDDLPEILSTDHYVGPRGDRRVRRPLPAKLDPFILVASDATGAIYVGYNRGEWGGGLRRIDPMTGSVSFVSAPGETICGGELNPACEPVIGLFRDHRAPECVIVGTGLSHLSMGRGDVYRVCGTTISSVFTTPAPTEAERDQWQMPGQPWPLFELTETEDGWVAVSRGRYFRLRGEAVQARPMPEFSEWAGLRISAEQDGVLFIVSACCWGSSAGELFSVLAVPVAE